MQCEHCGVTLEEAQVYNFQGKVLCEDCCFGLMNPPKVCDPTAVSSTLTVRKQLGQEGTDGLTELQKQIYTTVIERGKISRQELMAVMKLTPQELEQQFVILRHCELLKSFKEDNVIYVAKF
jgi:hypothetical protein